MKLGLLSLLAFLLWQRAGSFPAQDPSEHMLYKRSIETRGTGPTCAIIDSAVFAHASPSLKDLRLFTSTGELPYSITLSETAEMTTDFTPATETHPITAGVAFDLAMPPRPFSDVDLDVQQRDFLWTAIISGADSPNAAKRTPLGTFSLFDLTARHLSRNTTLPLQESTFRYLHVELHGSHINPAMILGAQVPPSRETQTLYTVVAQTSLLRQQGSEAIATFRIPARVPVERVLIELAPSFSGNFNRDVRVHGQADTPGDPVENIEGSITRVRLGRMQKKQMAFTATMGVNLQEDATIRVAIEDGDERPLPISSVKLEMRERNICFNASSAVTTLFYGDSTLSAPHNGTDQSPLQQHPLSATLGPEMRNPAFAERQKKHAMSNKTSDLVWLLVLIALAGFGTLALRTLRRTVR